MKIETAALIGAGAVGAYFVWGLSEKMGSNFFVVADGERKERLMREGIRINEKQYMPNVKTPEEANSPDLLLIATKYEALESAMKDIKTIVGEQTIVLSLLNGVDSEERIEKEIGPGHMMYSLMRIASVRNASGITFSPEITRGIYFGEKGRKEPTERAKAVEELLNGTGIHYTFVEDIMTDIWVKYASEELTLFEGVKKTARFSTLQDLDAKRHTEIEMFAGEMVRMGKEAGIAVPYCEYTYHMIKALEEKHDGKFAYDEDF